MLIEFDVKYIVKMVIEVLYVIVGVKDMRKFVYNLLFVIYVWMVNKFYFFFIYRFYKYFNIGVDLNGIY